MGVSGTREWAKHSLNVQEGCTNGCIYCVEGSTPILLSDWTVAPIRSLVAGASIIGAEYSGGHLRMTKTTVKSLWSVQAAAYKIVLSDGREVTCGEDHLWWAQSRSGRWAWRFATKGDRKGRRSCLQVGSKIKSLAPTRVSLPATKEYKQGYLVGLIEGDGHLASYNYDGKRRKKDRLYQFRLAMRSEAPVRRAEAYLFEMGVQVKPFLFPMKDRKTKATLLCPAIRTSRRGYYQQLCSLVKRRSRSPEFLRGFLAGFFDAEGGSNPTLRLSNTSPDLIELAQAAAIEFGFNLPVARYGKGTNKPVAVLELKGGRLEVVRFFQTFTPACTEKSGLLGRALHGKHPSVVAIKPAGCKKLWDMETGTGTFFAEGLLSHNCYASAKPGPLKRLPESYGKRSGTTMFPTQHDITLENVERCIEELKALLGPGNSVLIVSKPSLSVIEQLLVELEPWKAQVLFRFTIGSLSQKVLSFWEPCAPGPEDRRDSLQAAFAAGWATSVSMEPVLDRTLNDIVAVVEALSPYVTDSIWLGKANRLVERLKANNRWEGAENVVVRVKAGFLLKSQTDECILALYEQLEDHPKVRWKESIKQVVGLELLTEAGGDR